jgi:hypothetical protein
MPDAITEELACARAVPDDAEAAKVLVRILTDNGIFVYCPDEGAMDDVERERWDTCVKIVQKLREYYNPPVHRFAATDPVPREFLEIDAGAYPICPECGGDNVGIIAAPNDIPRWLCECGWRGES